MNLPNFIKRRSVSPDMLTSLFEHHLLKCCDILKLSQFKGTPEDEYDLYAVTYIVSDLAFFAVGKNRDKMSTIVDTIVHRLSVLYPDNSYDDFANRIDFYTSIMRGASLHAHVLPGVDISNADPVTRCAIAFCDCLIDPLCRLDYDDCSVPMFSAFEVFNIATEVYKPLIVELSALYTDMCKFAKKS